MRKKTTRVLAALLAALCLAGTLGGCTAKNKGGGSGASPSEYAPQETAKYGVMTGSTAEQYVMDNYPDAGLFTYPSISDAVVALGTGKLDYVLTPYTTALNAIRKDSNLEIYKDNVMPDTSAIAVSKDNPTLLEQLNDVLDTFRADGTLDRVTANWTTPGADYVVEDIPQSDGANGTLRVAVSADREPVCFVMDGAYSGLDCELIERIAYGLDMKVEYQNMQFSSLIAALSSGKADVIISNMTPTEERSQSVDFTQPYFDNPQVLLAKKREGVTPSAAPEETRPPVETSRPGVMVGSTNEIYAETNYPDAEILRFNNYVDSAAALTAGKLDYAMMDYTNALRHIRGNAELELASDFLTDEKLCLGINRNNPQLHEEVSQALEELREDGTLQAVIDRWIKSDGSDYDVVERPVREDGTVVKVAIVSSREPTTFMIDGTYQGLNVELIDRILYKLGYRPEYIDMEWGAVVASISSNKADMTLGMYNTPERAEKLLFTAPFFDNPQVLVSRKGTGAAPTEGVGEYIALSQLEGKKIATLTGSVFDQYVAPLIPNVEFLYFNGTADQLAAVKSGKVDAIAFDEPVARLAVANNPDLIMMDQVLAKHEYAIPATKGNPLVAQAGEVVRALRADGTLDEMAARWLGSDESQKVLPQLPNSGENGTIKVISYIGSEPMCYMGDGEIIGYEVELVLRIGQALGKQVEITSADFTAMMPMLQSGKADLGIGCIIVTEERLKMVDMVEPHYTGGFRLVVRRQENAPSSDSARVPEYATLEEISDKTISALTGSTFDTLVKGVLPNISFSYFNSTVDEISALKGGKVEGVPTDEPVAKLFMARNPDLVILPETVLQDRYGVALAKDSPLTDEVNAVIQDLRDQGIFEEMTAKWTGGDESAKTMPELPNSGENGVLRAVCYVGLEPMCYLSNEQIVGYDVELLLMRVGSALGKKVELISADFGALIPMLQSGKADLAVGCMSITDERKQSVDMTEPYYTGGLVLLVRAVEPLTETSGFWADLKDSFTRTFLTENRWKLVLDGLWITVLLSVCSGVFGTMLGFGICMLRRSKSKLASLPAAGLIRLIQGTPIVVLLMILYYIIFGSVDISAILVAILGFSINFGVYVSEMMRTGIDAVDRGQIEAASALGFSKVQTFWKITFPQAARHFLPVFKGEFISMVKMTSVVGYIAIQDLTKVSDIIRSRTLEAFFPLIATAIIYFAVANVMTMILSRIEIKLDPKRRKRAVKGVTLQ